MAANYYTLLTNIGQAKIANAIALGQQVAWTNMAVGDGNGNPTTPVQTQTALVREVYRAGINQLTVDPANPNYMVAELIVPTAVGGWAVHEVGIFDADGDLVAVANFPATYKPQLEEGSGRDLVIRIIVQVSNASVVTLRVDPAIVLASQAWVAANYLLKSKVAGGTTGQVLAKNSNSNEDFKWIDPSAAVSVNVNTLREIQTLAAAQTVVTLAQRTTTGLAVYVEGARLLEGIDWTANNTTQLTLAQAYPAGSRIHVYQNDPFSTLADPTEVLRGLPTVATSSQIAAGAVGKMVDAAKLKSALDARPLPMGVGQTRTDMTAQRAIGQSYTNTSGRSIEIHVTITIATTTTALMDIGGISGVCRFFNPTSSPVGTTFSAVVKDGEIYTVTGATLIKWTEVR